MATLRVITVDGELVLEEDYDNEFQACNAMDEFVGDEGMVVQVLLDDFVYAEEIF